MESSLKMFVLINKDRQFREVDAVIKYNEEDAWLYFMEKEDMQRWRIADDIFYYACLHYKEDAIEVFQELPKMHRFNAWMPTYVKENAINLAKLVLPQWGIELDSIELENLFDEDNDGEICTSFCEQFHKLPREKQIELAKFRLRQNYYIKDLLLGNVDGIEKVTQPLENEIKKMRLEALKAARPDVPGEIVDMCIGKYL